MFIDMTLWPNGKALLSGGKDCEFESRKCRVFLAKLREFLGMLYIKQAVFKHLSRFMG